MATYILCLTTGGGVPLFTRMSTSLKPLPFPVIGSLNGVHMFGINQDVELLASTTDDAKVIWKVFHESVTMIAVSQDDMADDCHLTNLLNYAFQIVVLLCGLDEVTNIKNIERFKKELKVCNQLIDKLVEPPVSFSTLTNTVETIASPESTILQNFLDAFTEAAESSFGCLYVDDRIVVATRKWWSLSSNELVLLTLLISSLQRCSSRDIPIFLPDSHPTIPHRLMTFRMTRKTEVCVICGQTPSLADLENEVGRFWRPAYDSLLSATSIVPRNIPSSMVLDPNIQCFLLVNTETSRCLGSVNSSPESSGPLGDFLTVPQRREVLSSFYKKMVGTFFTSVIEGSDTGPLEFTHQPMETYITTDSHKCYALQSGPYQIYVVYTDSIPTYAMRSVSHKTLSLLTKDKNIQV
ncbi:protein fuzzy homolog [Mytilus californianus]|uniref:protein fuzzy homolog n=1 Tax=Mytilus californianus TaxID=6549 RepID=UPI0022472F24|nr:protein fuzzy homolog [Mytilus californianus]